MPEHEYPKRKKLNLDGELGISRRDLLRRGAIAGGTLLWVAPAIQSLAPAASAQARQGPSPGDCSVCYCTKGSAPFTAANAICTVNGPPATPIFPGHFSADDCENWCKHNAPYNTPSNPGAPGGPYGDSDYCSGTDCSCSLSTGPSCS